MPDLEKLLERLISHRVEFVLIGGYAAMMHGASYVTFDVDVCCPMNRGNFEKIHRALADLHPFHRETPQRIPFIVREGLNNCYLATDLGKIDFLGSVLDVGDYAQVLAHSTEMELPFGRFLILDCGTLIRAKEAVGREKDALVVRQLRAIIEATSPPI